MDFGGKLHFPLSPLLSKKLLNNERIFNNLVKVVKIFSLKVIYLSLLLYSTLLNSRELPKRIKQ